MPSDNKLSVCALDRHKYWEDEEVAAADVAVDSLAFLDGKMMRYRTNDRQLMGERYIVIEQCLPSMQSRTIVISCLLDLNSLRGRQISFTQIR